MSSERLDRFPPGGRFRDELYVAFVRSKRLYSLTQNWMVVS
jgi:hypothetical protein